MRNFFSRATAYSRNWQFYEQLFTEASLASLSQKRKSLHVTTTITIYDHHVCSRHIRTKLTILERSLREAHSHYSGTHTCVTTLARITTTKILILYKIARTTTARSMQTISLLIVELNVCN